MIFGRRKLKDRTVNMTGQGLELGLCRDGTWVLRYYMLIFLGSTASLFFWIRGLYERLRL